MARGLKKGQVHSGSFKPGHDPRRFVRSKQVTDMAREHTEACVAMLANTLHDTKASRADRIKAATILLDRGWGKAPSHHVIEDLTDKAPSDMTMGELEQYLRNHVVIEGEFTPVEQPLLSRDLSSNG